ncbi:hypothetical protein BK709_14975 [Bacillus thuringiensis serovar shandongiensis]|uniref:hypothetical protein n=1 Tax=Bacillus toyonensis TaxID=155322 RepID=UPI000B445B20|nr:hypothetical protein [Bacillus toyonensis]MEC2394403.1 hypothetical protein [Bacillus toyonensis]OTX37598.1 hypothetical protein BK717_10000 [Bacillus thuringiensis serovar malayensis]OUB06352.1 hypothetical protein BK709_14975 [Bacillus thuringiensis serovar shandongiensis]
MDMQKRRMLVAGIVLAVVLGVGYFSTDVLQTLSIVCFAVVIVFGVIRSIQKNGKTRIKELKI